MHKIYQNGYEVGDVKGGVIRLENSLYFEQLVKTGQLDISKPIEYHAMKLGITDIATRRGMKSVTVGEDSVILIDVMEGVKCQVLARGDD